MPINVDLIRENRVVLQTYSEPLNSNQLSNLRGRMESVILASATGKLHIIADFRGIQNLPATMLSSGSVMLRNPHPNTGHIVCVTSSDFVTTMALVFAKLSPKQDIVVVRSLEAAYSKIDALLSTVS